MEYVISDWDYILSTVGNAYFSHLTYEELWACVTLSETREQLDAAVSATIRLKEIVDEKCHSCE